METKMRRLVIPVREAQAGTRVAADLRNAGGGILVAAGAELDEALIDGLRRRGIDIVSVELPDTRTAEEIAAALAAARLRLAELFRRHGSEPATQALRDAVLDYRLKSLA